MHFCTFSCGYILTNVHRAQGELCSVLSMVMQLTKVELVVEFIYGGIESKRVGG